MGALREATQELSPSWRAARDAARRVHADKARIAAVLATHPHPDPADRDPKARAAAYTGRVSDVIRAGHAAAEAAQEQAAAAMLGRSRLTRFLAGMGIRTHGQREAARLAQHATALTDAAGRAVSKDDYAHARATGEAHAYAAQKSTRLWEAQPHVAHALEQHRLNGAAEAALKAGDPTVTAAMAVGDPDGARTIIRQREAEQERQTVARERLADLAREMHGLGSPTPPSPGRT